MIYKDRWSVLDTRFLALQVRERALIAVTLLAAIVLLGWQFGVAPGLHRADQALAQIDDLQVETRELEAQLARVKAELAKDPNAPLRQRQLRLQARFDEQQARLESLADGLVSPEAMVALLRQMLGKHLALTLVSVAHDPAVPVEPALGEGDSSGLYSHGITLTLSGRYFELVEYLQELEALDDRLGWSALRYEVQEWPIGRMQIHLKTLSLSEEWLGV